MPSTSRPVALAAGILALALALTGCATTRVSGQASPPSRRSPTSHPPTSPITGSAETEADVTSRNALADLNDYWAQVFPRRVREDFTQLTGGYFSSTRRRRRVGPTRRRDRLQLGARGGRADRLYCPPDVGPPTRTRSATTARSCRSSATSTGRFLPALIMAHEFGHAVQAGSATPTATPRSTSRPRPTASPVPGPAGWPTATRSTSRSGPPSSTACWSATSSSRPPGTACRGGPGARFLLRPVSAIQDGYDGGRLACRDNYEPTGSSHPERVRLRRGPGLRRQRPAREVANLIQTALPIYYEDSFPDDLAPSSPHPRSRPSTATPPGCGGLAPDAKVGFCADDDTVYYDDSDLAVRPTSRSVTTRCSPRSPSPTAWPPAASWGCRRRRGRDPARPPARPGLLRGGPVRRGRPRSGGHPALPATSTRPSSSCSATARTRRCSPTSACRASSWSTSSARVPVRPDRLRPPGLSAGPGHLRTGGRQLAAGGVTRGRRRPPRRTAPPGAPGRRRGPPPPCAGRRRAGG